MGPSEARWEISNDPSIFYIDNVIHRTVLAGETYEPDRGYGHEGSVEEAWGAETRDERTEMGEQGEKDNRRTY